MSACTGAIVHSRSRAREEDASAAVVSSNVLLAIVNARGVIDGESAAPFARELGQAVDAGATKLLVDLTQTNEVTTAGMNTMLAARQRLVADGGEIAVALPPAIGRQFEALGLDRRFRLAEDRAHAARLLGLLGEGSPGAGAPAPHAHAA
jgi:anti-anti-sigma regulatory factor